MTPKLRFLIIFHMINLMEVHGSHEQLVATSNGAVDERVEVMFIVMGYSTRLINNFKDMPTIFLEWVYNTLYLCQPFCKFHSFGFHSTLYNFCTCFLLSHKRLTPWLGVSLIFHMIDLMEYMEHMNNLSQLLR